MASSSKNISMPLVFAISIGSVFAMIACTVFAMAWYSYENKKIVTANVDAAPMHSPEYQAKYGEGDDAEQMMNLQRFGRADVQVEGAMPERHRYMPIEDAMDKVVLDNGGHLEHSHEDDGHDHDDHAGHDH
ncbi:MAG: hypothetical protein ACIAXF_02225 [Phycisphaerales bacterium JB063]